MRLLNLVVIVTLALASSAAQGASLTVTSDQSVYNIGERVTLTVVGSSNGVTEVSTQVFARLNFFSFGPPPAPPGLVFVSSSQVPGTSFNFGEWTAGNLAHGPDDAVAINQIINLSPRPASRDASGTVVLQVAAVGNYMAAFDLATADYFGATPGAPALFSVLPEPASGSLLALGLLSLGLSRRLKSLHLQSSRIGGAKCLGRGAICLAASVVGPAGAPIAWPGACSASWAAGAPLRPTSGVPG